MRPLFSPERILHGGGGGVVNFEPPAAGISYAPPSFIFPSPLEGYFQGWGGCIEFGPAYPRACLFGTEADEKQDIQHI